MWNEPYEPKSEETAEARQLVGELRDIYDRLKRADQRYVTSLTDYLTRLGDETLWGTQRLGLLRRIHAEYFKTEAEPQATTEASASNVQRPATTQRATGVKLAQAERLL